MDQTQAPQLDMNQLASLLGMKDLELIYLRQQVQTLAKELEALKQPVSDVDK